MDASQIIRESVSKVEALREEAESKPTLADAVTAVKLYQSRRFERSYRDLLQGGPFQSAARFFLVELYGDADYSGRDAQFARIAGALESMLPKPAIATAVALARLHALTEELDFKMGLAWESDNLSCADVRYVTAWRTTGHREERDLQLRLVLEIGHDLDRLTRTRGLRLLLKLMRGPAHAAGLQDLQRFLEVGFDTFASMGKQNAGASTFLGLIKAREEEIINNLFDLQIEFAVTSLTY